jgi:hypothetical protein
MSLSNNNNKTERTRLERLSDTLEHAHQHGMLQKISVSGLILRQIDAFHIVIHRTPSWNETW